MHILRTISKIIQDFFLFFMAHTDEMANQPGLNAKQLYDCAKAKAVQVFNSRDEDIRERDEQMRLTEEDYVEAAFNALGDYLRIVA